MAVGASKKAIYLAGDIELCRTTGRWKEIPELARRYLKHHSAGGTLHHAILAEYSVYAYLDTLDEIDIYANDGPGNISVPTGLTGSALEDALRHAQQAAELATTPAEREDAAVITAMINCFAGRFAEADEALESISWPPVNEQDMPVSLEAYRQVLVIQAWIIKGITLEKHHGNFERAVQHQSTAWALAKECGQKERGDTLSWWIEEALYRRPLLEMAYGTRALSIAYFRDYRDCAMAWPADFRPSKRLAVCRYGVPLVSAAYTSEDYQPSTPAISTGGDTPAIQVPLTFRQEVLQLHALYEDAMHRCMRFPRANQVNMQPLEMIEQMMSDWKLIGAASRSERRALVETLYRATEITFQSPAIMRHLLNALIALGEFEEAELALDSYANLIGKRDAISSEVGQMTVTSASLFGSASPATVITATTANASLAATDNDETSAQPSTCDAISKVREDAEHPEKAVETLLIGAHLAMTNIVKPEDCVKYAEIALSICEEHKGVVDARTYSSAWQLVGAGYGLMARQCDQHETRPSLYEKAISALTEAISRNPENAEAHYHLALQHADSRNLAQALVSVKQSLQLDASQARAWHLLALLMSANKDIEGALRICQVGIDTSGWEVMPDGSGECQGTSMEGEDILALMVTKVALEDLLHGPEKALSFMNALFTFYGRVFAGDGGGSTASEVNGGVVRRVGSDQSAHGGHQSRPSQSNASIAPPRRNLTAGVAASRNGRLDIPMSGSTYTGSVNGGGSVSGGRAGMMVGTTASSRSSYSLATRVTTRVRLRRQRALRALTEIWLLSASAFRRLGRFEDARQAVEEAEGADSESADVCCQTGLLLMEQQRLEEATAAFVKAIFLEPHHVAGNVLLGRANLLTNKHALAEGLLRKVTRGLGWNCAEAWHYLGTVYRDTDRSDRAKECYWYALDLESTRPARMFLILQP